MSEKGLTGHILIIIIVMSGPPAIRTISSGVLEGCTSLTSVTIDEGTAVIDSYVFKGCKSLTELYIPRNVQEIDLEALLGLSSLTKITVSPNNKVFKEHEGVPYRYDKNYDVYYLEHYPSMKESTTYNVIDKTHWIDNLAFINNKFLVTLNLPLCIDDVGDSYGPLVIRASRLSLCPKGMSIS